MEIIRRQVKRHRRSVLGQWTIRIVVAAMIVTGTYLVIENQTYTSVATADSHKKDTEDSNQYIAFSDGVIRYSRDGVVFLNKKNKEKWIQPCQIQNPIVDVNEDVFAIADVGGNTIMIFQKSGLKGEIETTLPIEKISVSNQGIVSAILKNESTPQIISYDAVGNILVEHQVNLNSTGYPISLDMSADGENLMVSYLSTKNGTLKSMVAFYNFGKEGQEKTDNLMYAEDFDQTVVPDVFYMDASTSVAVGDKSFVIYEGTKSVKKKTEVKLNQEIRSEFHSERYIGFILTNKDKSGYEVQLYDKTGKQIINREITGEYSHVKIAGDEIIMFDRTKGCIISDTGIQRFKGDWGIEAQEVIPVAGIHRYLIAGEDELRLVYLTN